MSHFPLIESLNALLKQFEEAAKRSGVSVGIYEELRKSNELVRAIETRLFWEGHTFKMPEGFRKITEKVPKYSYKLPACALNHLK